MPLDGTPTLPHPRVQQLISLRLGGCSGTFGSSSVEPALAHHPAPPLFGGRPWCGFSNLLPVLCWLPPPLPLPVPPTRRGLHPAGTARVRCRLPGTQRAVGNLLE